MHIKMLELVLIVVVVLGLGFWQLFDINRELRKDRDKRQGDTLDRSSDSEDGTRIDEDTAP